MANWVTLANGVHIDLDDPNNPLTGSGSFSDLGKGGGDSSTPNYKVGATINVPHHENVKGQITRITKDTIEVEYETRSGVMRKDTYYKEDFDKVNSGSAEKGG